MIKQVEIKVKSTPHFKPPCFKSITKINSSRETAIIEISSTEIGKNLRFNCFSSKLISSVTDFTVDARFREFARRSLLIETKKIEDFSDEEKSLWSAGSDFDPSTLLDYSSLDWFGFHEEYENFWKTNKQLSNWQNILGEIDEAIQFEEKKMKPWQWTISRELMAVSILIQLYDNVKDAIPAFSRYWELVDSKKSEDNKKAQEILSDFLCREKSQIDTFNQRYSSNLPYSVKHDQIRQLFDTMLESGQIDKKPTLTETKAIMLNLGWYQKGSDWVLGK